MQHIDKKLNELNITLGGRVKRDEILAQHTTFRIGGPAALYFCAKNNHELVTAVAVSKNLKIPFFILSGGSNVLISDAGLDFFVIHIKTADLIVSEPFIIADAGVPLADLVNASIEKGMKGLVWASGIPGNVGGAIRGNAGAYGGEIKDSLHSVEIMRGRKEFILENEQCKFGYRDSMFKHNSDIILTGKFELEVGFDKELLKKQSEEIIEIRSKKHPHTPTAGSFFKNILVTDENRAKLEKLGVPEEYWKYGKVPAGWLLDQVKMRGTKVGGAEISAEHANIITNTGEAEAQDVLELADMMKQAVKDKFGIELEAEVQVAG